MTLPLARASLRLRGVAGFPRAIGRPRLSGKVSDSAAQPTVVERVGDSALAQPASVHPAPAGLEGLWPRLLTLPRAADYLGLGFDTIKELAASGELRQARVSIPAPTTAKRKGGRIALVLLDRLELDRLVSAWRERA